MGLPPAYLFVVRHGLRLDAADKQWHLSSPTPYDPPLTYLGWQQAKNLGARIGSLIRERVAEEKAAEKQLPEAAGRKRKRYKVVLHSSPFLRCIQTAVAISAGLAQDSTPFGSSQTPDNAPPSPPIFSPRSRPTVIPDSKDLSLPKPAPIRRSVLRLDAFLGEWLSPGYFELITPPPESVMMLAGAKADLLRREDYNSYLNFSPRAHSNSQGHLWSPTSRPGSVSTTGPDPFDAMSSLVGSSQSSGSISSLSSQSRAASVSAPSESSGYISPVPHWAANINTIPPGYVAHARDACVDIDYQWDSMRHPLDWGDGGSFPEEWTAMHRRFRKGIQHMIDWYSTAQNPTDMVTKTAGRFGRKASIDKMGDFNGDDDDVETEAIVIMVSHGAGCNALIGAITHQPVLMDVAMASLTMAVRKPAAEMPDASQAVHHRGWASPERKKDTVPVHQLYDLKIFASTDHLRSTPPTPAATRSSSVASGVNGPRGRFPNSFASALNNFTFNDSSTSRSSSANTALSGLRRGEGPYQSSKLSSNISSDGPSLGGITVGSGVTSFASTKPSSLARTPSIGLWSPISTQEDSLFEDEDEDDGMLLNFSHEKLTPVELTPQVVTPRPLTSEGYFDLSLTPGTVDGAEGEEAVAPSPITLPEMSKDESSDSDAGTGGLWGGPRPPDEADRLRDTSSTKRRWTVTERS